MQSNSSKPVNWAVYLGGPADLVRQATMVLSGTAPVHFRESRVIEFSGQGERYQLAIDSGVNRSLPTDMFLIKQCASVNGMEARQVARHAARFEGDFQSDFRKPSGSISLFPNDRNPLNLKEVFDVQMDDGMPIFGHLAHNLGSPNSVAAWRMLPHRTGTAPKFPAYEAEGAHQTIDSQRETIALALDLTAVDGDQVSERELRRQVFEESGYARYAIQTNSISILPKMLAEKFPGLVVAAVPEDHDPDLGCQVWLSDGGNAESLVPSLEDFRARKVEWFNRRPEASLDYAPGSKPHVKQAWVDVQAHSCQLLFGEATFLKSAARGVRAHRALLESAPGVWEWEGHQILAEIRRYGLEAWLNNQAKHTGEPIEKVAAQLISRNPRGLGGYGVADACLAHENVLMQPAQIEAANGCVHEWVDMVADLMHPRQQHYPLSCLRNSIDDDPKEVNDDEFSITTEALDADECGSEPAYRLLQRLTSEAAGVGPKVMARVLASDCGLMGSSQAGHYISYAVLMDVDETTSPGVRSMLAEMSPNSTLVRHLRSTAAELNGVAERQSAYRFKTGQVGVQATAASIVGALNAAPSWLQNVNDAAIRDARTECHGLVRMKGPKAFPVTSDSELSESFVLTLSSIRMRTTYQAVLDRDHVEHRVPKDWKARNAAIGLIGVAGTTWGNAVPEVREMLLEHGVPKDLILRSIATRVERIERFVAAGGELAELAESLSEVYQTRYDFQTSAILDPRQIKAIPPVIRESYARLAAARIMSQAISTGLAQRRSACAQDGLSSNPKAERTRTKVRL